MVELELVEVEVVLKLDVELDVVEDEEDVLDVVLKLLDVVLELEVDEVVVV